MSNPGNSDTAIRAEEALTWYVRLTSGHATDEDWARHTDWLAENPGNAAAFSRVQREFSVIDAARDDVLKRYRPTQARRGNGGWASLWTMISKRPAVFSAALAAAMVFVVVIASLPSLHPDTTRFETASGEIRQIMLADGSTVDLDTNSAIEVSIGNNVRTAMLDRGRAIFDVQHDADRPFLVDVGDHRVRVLGTKFEVSALSGHVSVAVARGSVGVGPREQATAPLMPHILKAGDKVLFAKGSHIPTPQQVDLEDFGTWREHRLTFDAVPLHEVLDEINRYFPNQMLRMGTPDLQDRIFTGSLFIGSGETVARNLAGFMSLGLRQDGDTFVLEAPSGSESDS